MAGDRRTQPSFCDLWTDGHVCPTTIQGYTTYSRRKIELKPLEYHNCSTSIIDKYCNPKARCSWLLTCSGFTLVMVIFKSSLVPPIQEGREETCLKEVQNNFALVSWRIPLNARVCVSSGRNPISGERERETFSKSIIQLSSRSDIIFRLREDAERGKESNFNLRGEWRPVVSANRDNRKSLWVGPCK